MIHRLFCTLHEVPPWQSRVDVHHWGRYLKSELLLVPLPLWAHIHYRFPVTKCRSYPFWKRERRSCQSVVTPSAHVSKIPYWQSKKCSLRCKKESRYHFAVHLNTQALKFCIIAFSFVLLFTVSSKENASPYWICLNKFRLLQTDFSSIPYIEQYPIRLFRFSTMNETPTGIWLVVSRAFRSLVLFTFILEYQASVYTWNLCL